MKAPQSKASLKKDSVLVYAGHFLRYLFPLILVPYYGRVLGPAGYGQVLASTALMGFIFAIVGYGFDATGARDMACAETQKERDEILSRQMVGRLVLIPLGVVVGVMGTLLSGTLREQFWMGALGGATGIVTAFNYSWLYQGLREFRLAILTNTLLYPVHIALVFWLVRGPDDGIYAMLSLFTAALVSQLVSSIIKRRFARFRFFSIKAAWQEIKVATTFFVSTIGATVLSLGLTYTASLFLADADVGHFGVAERFVTLGITLLNPLGQVLMPHITKLHSKDSGAQAWALARKGLALEMAYSFSAAVGGVFLAPYVLPFILGAGFKESVVVFQWLVCVLPFAAVRHALFQFVLIPMHEERHYLRVTAINVLATFGLLALLMPLLGTKGIAVARLGGEIVATVVLIVPLLRKSWFLEITRARRLSRLV